MSKFKNEACMDETFTIRSKTCIYRGDFNSMLTFSIQNFLFKPAFKYKITSKKKKKTKLTFSSKTDQGKTTFFFFPPFKC